MEVTSKPDSPLWKQYEGLKARHPGAILFFHLGDFYEMFGDDARAAAPILGLVLTQRQGIPMCGVPAHSAPGHIAKLLKTGRKVAIADQVEDPALAKGIVRREVTRVISPGTVVDDTLLDPGQSNFLAALQLKGQGWMLAVAEVSTGRFETTPCPADAEFRRLGEVLARVAPSELLLLPGAAEHPEIKARIPAGTILTLVEGADAVGAIRDYVAENEPLLKLGTPVNRPLTGRMQLDATAIRTLELVSSQEGDPARSLWGVLDRCRTAMGRRLLKEWILAPLTDLAAIRARQDRVRDLYEEPVERTDIQDRLADFPDLERIVTRVVTKRTNPKELSALRRALTRLAALEPKALRGVTPSMLSEVEALREMLEKAVAEDPPVKLADGGALRAGWSKELDELRAVKTDAHSWLTALEAREREATGIGSLKVSFNSVFGYYIEVTRLNAPKVPASYARKQTLANAERYITEELKGLEGKILGAEDAIVRLEAALFEEVRAQVEARAVSLQAAAAAVAELDLSAGLAELAERQEYVLPIVEEGTALDIAGGRHPVVERVIPGGQFVPNDLQLDGRASQIAILTGPNMAGKSTYLRQNALIVLMAQMGAFVPARSARVGIVDRVMTRIGARDSLSAGESTFMVEMRETAEILAAATPRSLLVLDEVGRGTSTYDGISIAWSVLEWLNRLRDADGTGPKVLFATHYFELCELEAQLPGVRNLNVLVKEWKRPDGHTDVAFLHRIAPGPADRSYGIHVAKLAGLPVAVLKRAREILEKLEREQRKSEEKRSQDTEQPALPLFTEHPVVEQLRALDTDSMTPLKALQTLSELKGKLLLIAALLVAAAAPLSAASLDEPWSEAQFAEALSGVVAAIPPDGGEREVVIPNRQRVQGGTLCLPPANGKAPGVVLLHGSGPFERDHAIPGAATADGKTARLFKTLSDSLCSAGFVVLRYDKRGVTGYDEVADQPVTDQGAYAGNTVNKLVFDGAAAVKFLKSRPEVDAKNIVLLGISEGTGLAPLVDMLTPVRGLVLLSAYARRLDDIVYYQSVERPLAMTLEVVDEDGDKRLSAGELARHPDFIIPQDWDRNGNGFVESAELSDAFILLADANPVLSQMRKSPWYVSHLRLPPNAETLAKFRGPILLFQGEKDWQTPVSEVALIKKALKGGDLTVKVFPGLGHGFSRPKSPMQATLGPIEGHVLEAVTAGMREKFMPQARY